MFWALAEGAVDTRQFEFEHILRDIQTLNEWALSAKLEVTALSLNAYPHVQDDYILLPHGASMGSGYGPIVVSQEPIALDALKDVEIAVPGKLTTSFLVLSLFLGTREFRYRELPFDEIMPAVERGEFAAGLLIQRLPVEGAGNLAGVRNEDRIGLDEAFNRIAHLASTLTREELLALDADTILRRLFWEEDLRRFEPLAGASGPRFHCSCSRERVAGMLRSLGREEIESILAEQGRVEIGCDFCGIKYHFDPVDSAGLFLPAGSQPPGSSTLN